MVILLPVNLLKFWYPRSYIVFSRIWKNLLLLIDEDLAVRLMIRLLYVPLFHDASLIGKILSFIFRTTRIFLGLFGFLITSLFIIIIASVWFITPLALLVSLISQFFSLPNFGQNLKGLSDIFPVFALGLILFAVQLLKPAKKVSQLVSLKQIWQATRLKPQDIRWDKLLASDELKQFLLNLELKPETFFTDQQIELTENYLQNVWKLAKKTQALYLTESYFWLEMLFSLPNVETELLKINLTKTDFEAALTYFEQTRDSFRKFYIWDEEFRVKHLRGTNRGWLGAPTPSLDVISTDLTKQASRQETEDFVGRENIISEVITILSQAKNRNVLLVGPAGAGKTTLVNQLAKQIILGDAPEALATKRLVKLEIPKLLSSVTTEGDLAKKVKDAFEEVQFIEDIIIFIDEFHELGIGDAGKSFNLFSLILPYLESDSFQFIATTEPDNFAKILEKNASLARLFNKVDLTPATEEDTIKVLKKRAIELLHTKKISTTYKAIAELAKRSSELIHDRVLPDSALVIYQEAETLSADDAVTSSIIDQVLTKRIKVPLMTMDNSQKQLLLNLEQKIHERLIDQEPAVKAVADSLRRSATELREKNRPIGSFLFVGPTGVGKTELAKILSDIYFNKQSNDQRLTTDSFIRFDMSEFQTDQAVDRLLGTYDNPGELTEAVKNKPYCLLLLDEFEKAHHKILTLFLQILDDGRLTDGSGKTIDFTNTIIIATSNSGSVLIAQELESGKSIEDLTKEVREELLQELKPELVNRFDSIVIFKPLSQADLEKIVTIKLDELAQTLKDQGYLIEFSPDLKTELAKKGFDPVLGARPLRRLIQDTLESNLSKLILEGKLKKGVSLTLANT